ncbi:MAG: ABC transporter ATP-binding protein/permease [Proteobacteria bacterium]|nr:ABC transporter ATP-binding protein/permease [Pseudomonadota bacterium]MBU1738655.1 ABC transporter ATP-binding protein/permease [Pseudomonadota bacterium]
MHQGFGYFEEERLQRSDDIHLWRRLLLFTLPHWLEVVAAILLSLAITGCGLALPHLVRQAIDGFIINQNLDPAARIAGVSGLATLFMILVVAGFAANFLQVVVLEKTGQQIMHTLRQKLFTHMLSLETAFFNRNPIGKLVTRLTNDIQNMHEMFTSVIVTLFNDLIKLVGILTILMLMNWRLAALMLVLIPIILLNTLVFSRLARIAFRDIRTNLARLNSFLQEALHGISVVQIFAREKSSLDKFAELNETYFKKTLYQIKIFGIFMPLLEVLSSSAVAMILWYGGGQFLQDRISIGVLVAFISYMRLFFQPLRELSQKYSIVQSALASAERIFQLLDTENRMVFAAKQERPITRGAIEFNNVTFGYDPENPVISGMNLTISPGETLAIVGSTGSGKTTIINLLERFYDPDQGRIRIDGHDLRDIATNHIRQHIGLVMQDVYIFPATIRENIVLDRDLAPSDLARIVRDSQLEQFIARLPEGLDTRIGEAGMDLSGGQKQLLALARVLARDPKILVLDEATSSVDTETEILIEKGLAATMAHRTSVVIAHRLSTIRRADRILVMEKGRIIEEGTHDFLMVKNGVYYRLQTMKNGIGDRIPG